MVLHFQHTLPQALQEIELSGEHKEFLIHDRPEPRTEDTIVQYGQAKWSIVDTINERYGAILNSNSGAVLNNKFDLYNWLYYNDGDEVAYFLNEAGSNTLQHAEFQAPNKFHLWLGKKGFIISIEQQGKGFDAQEVEKNNIQKNAGAAFDFFRRCESAIFFDDPAQATKVFFQYRFR